MSGDEPTALPRLAVVVLNYRTAELVEDCLDSLDGQIDGVECEVVVVDNASGDGSAERIAAAIDGRGYGSWARLHASDRNDGFAAGNNVGIAETDADVVVLLNSDTIVRPGAIETLRREFASRPDVHVIGPRLEWPDGTHQTSTFRYRTPLTELLYGSRLDLLFRLFPGHVVARELTERADDVAWASFACIAIRREVLQDVGPLDEGYFMYFEDMAYCRAARSRGHRIAYRPGARVVHLRGGTSPVKRLTAQGRRRPRYYYASRAHYFRTFYGLPGLWIANVLWTLGWLLGLLRGRRTSVEHEARDVWIGALSGGRR